MRTRKSAATASPLKNSTLRNSTLRKFAQTILGYIDLLVRTVCIILGLVVSGWVKFIDEVAPPPAPTRVSMSAPQWSPSRPLMPLPGMSGNAAQPTYTGHAPMFR